MKGTRRVLLASVEMAEVQAGTPLAALQRIVAFGRDRETDQGYCFAESGSVPVSGIAPPILLSELELQQSSTTGYHDPLLPPPFADDGSRGRKGGLRSRGKRRSAPDSVSSKARCANAGRSA